MRFFFILIFLTTTNLAMATEISCDLFVNGALEKSFVADLKLELKTKVASSSGLTFYLTEKESPRYLIEVFDPNVPARSYAEGVLITPKDQLKWSMWSREIWVELVCSLNK